MVVDRLVQAHGIHDGIHREDDLLAREVEIAGDLLDRRFALGVGHELFTRLQHLIGRVAHGARDADGAVVAQIAADLSDDHRHAVGRKAHVLADVEVVDGFDEPDAADLKQVVDVLAPPEKALDDRQHQPEIAADELLTRGAVALLRPAQQRRHLLVFQHRQTRRVDPADFHLPLHASSLHLSDILDGSSISPANPAYTARRNPRRFDGMGRAVRGIG